MGVFTVKILMYTGESDNAQAASTASSYWIMKTDGFIHLALLTS